MKFRILSVAMVALLLTLPGVTQAASFLEDEAGISASTHVDSVDLILAAAAFKNIEEQTSDYIIGSVALTDYLESDDVHVYLDASGDMIAYYSMEEFSSKIIDWRHDTSGALIGSRLMDALSNICDALAVTLPEVKYYDFRYPQATNIKIIVDEKTSAGNETLQFLIPGNYIIHSSTYSHYIKQSNYTGAYGCGSGTPTLKIDDVVITSSSNTNSWRIFEGEISPDQIAPDVYHVFTVYNSDGDCNSYGAIVLLYSVQ